MRRPSSLKLLACVAVLLLLVHVVGPGLYGQEKTRTCEEAIKLCMAVALASGWGYIAIVSCIEGYMFCIKYVQR